jgi:hypothetical protein
MSYSQRKNEDEILKYALDDDNLESFAKLLKKILPKYTTWVWGQDSIYRRHFNEWQKSGFNLLPNHYYSPIPDVENLRDAVVRKTDMIGLDLRMKEQLLFLETICPLYLEEYSIFPTGKTRVDHQFHFNNGVFERVDAEVLHCMIRNVKPKKIIEIGSGYSTLISAAACELNRKNDNIISDFTAIEPYPNDLFKKKIPGLSSVLQKPLQDLDVSYFNQLMAGDILFIDSSHILKVGSDVQMEYLEILPRLAPGVLIHIHDIFLPSEYPENWIKNEHIFWNEQYLLQSFLSFNESFEILWSGCNMHIQYPLKLANVFPGYAAEKYLPGSLWIRRTK